MRLGSILLLASVLCLSTEAVCSDKERVSDPITIDEDVGAQPCYQQVLVLTNHQCLIGDLDLCKETAITWASPPGTTRWPRTSAFPLHNLNLDCTRSQGLGTGGPGLM